MISKVKFLFSFLMFLTLSISCTEDGVLADELDPFVGKYEGVVSFNSTEESIPEENGYVEVYKFGNQYNLVFSGNIPTIREVSIVNSNGLGELLGATDENYIRISSGVLSVRYAEGDTLWSALCESE